MKKLLIILLSALSLMAVAQNQKIALLEPRAGEGSTDISGMEKAMLRGELRKAIVNQPGFEAFTRADIDQLMKEQDFQRTGNVSESDIHKLGVMSGADYICVSTLNKSNTEFYLEAYLINIETGAISNPASQYGELVNGKLANMLPVCESLALELLGNKAASRISASKSSQTFPTRTISFEEELRNAYTSPLYEVKPEWNLESLITEDCIINIPLFHDAVKNSNFAYAEKIWQNVYEECPNANKAIYKDGEKILKWRYENSMIESDKTKYLEKLIELYDKRIFYFGNDRKYPTPYILGQKGVILYNYAQTIQDKLKAYFLCKTSIAKQNDDSSIEVINTFFNASLWIYQNSPSHKKTLDEDYEKIDSILKTKCFDDPYDQTGVSKIRTNIRNKYENL